MEFSGQEERDTFAFIFPYRKQADQDRFAQLQRTLSNLSTLSLRHADNTVFIIVEQSNDGQLFNRGALLNAGTRYASDYCKRRKWSTARLRLVLHDVDLCPVIIGTDDAEDDDLGRCVVDNYFGPLGSKGGVRALGRAWKDCPYAEDRDFLGGVSVVSYNDYKTSGGFPNNYWGWGGEEVCWRYRIRAAGLTIEGPKPGLTLLDCEGPMRPPRTNKCPVRWELKRQWDADLTTKQNNYSDLSCVMSRIHPDMLLTTAAKDGGSLVHLSVAIDPVAHVAPLIDDSLTSSSYIQLPPTCREVELSVVESKKEDDDVDDSSPPPMKKDDVDDSSPPPMKKKKTEICIGVKKDGSCCSKKQRKGLLTCYSHRSQETKS